MSISDITFAVTAALVVAAAVGVVIQLRRYLRLRRERNRRDDDPLVP